MKIRYSDVDQYDLLLSSCKSMYEVTVAVDNDRRRSLSSRRHKNSNNLSIINNSYNK